MVMAHGAVVPLKGMKQRKREPVQIGIRVPPEWIDDAERLAAALSRPGLGVTRTEAFRAALARGLEAMLAEVNEAEAKAKTK